VSSETECLFCKILNGEIPADVVYENDLVLAFRDIAPAAPIHVLVIPRTHIDHAGAIEADNAESVVAMMLAAQEVAKIEGIDGPERGYRLVMNVGPDALNSVPHLHLHVVGGRSLTWPPG
jgi:histidine triad (HIT) family protein